MHLIYNYVTIVSVLLGEGPPEVHCSLSTHTRGGWEATETSSDWLTFYICKIDNLIFKFYSVDTHRASGACTMNLIPNGDIK